MACQSNTVSNAVLYPFVFLKTAVFKTLSPKCVVKTNSMFDESAQRSWITRDLTKRLGLLSKVRELLITPGFANSSSTLEFYEVVELNFLANDRTEVAIRAIVIGFPIDELDDMYREKLLELAHLKNLNLAHLPTQKRKRFKSNFSSEPNFTGALLETKNQYAVKVQRP